MAEVCRRASTMKNRIDIVYQKNVRLRVQSYESKPVPQSEKPFDREELGFERGMFVTGLKARESSEDTQPVLPSSEETVNKVAPSYY
jgi:hypothetical protein